MAASLRVGCAGCPAEERDPRMHMMAERRSEKLSLHLSQLIVWLYGWWNFVDIMVASLLYVVATEGPIPPATENTRGEKQPCSISLTL